MKGLFSSAGNRSKYASLLVGVALAASVAGPAMADPPTMTAISFPIDTASIAAAVAAAGATLLLAYFGIKVGFSLIKKLLNRLKSAV